MSLPEYDLTVSTRAPIDGSRRTRQYRRVQVQSLNGPVHYLLVDPAVMAAVRVLLAGSYTTLTVVSETEVVVS